MRQSRSIRVKRDNVYAYLVVARPANRIGYDGYDPAKNHVLQAMARFSSTSSFRSLIREYRSVDLGWSDCFGSAKISDEHVAHFVEDSAGYGEHESSIIFADDVMYALIAFDAYCCAEHMVNALEHS